MTQQEKYIELCQRVETFCRDNEEKRKYPVKNPKFGFLGYQGAGFPDRLYEINPWTYWQGIGNVGKKIRILVVGQDWGSIQPEFCRKFIDNIISERPYFVGFDKDYIKARDTTDYNLKEIFKAYDYQDLFRTRYDDLFFTNLIPGFRDGDVSGGNASSWLKQELEDLEFLCELIRILHPENIVCLGQPAFKGTMKALGASYKQQSFGKIIDAGPYDVEIDSKSTRVFAMAHPGFFGCSNRNRFSPRGDMKQPLKLLVEDWKKVFS